MKLPLFLLSLKFRLVAVVVATGLLSAAGTSALLLRATEAELRSQLLVMDLDEAERTAELLGGKLDILKRTLAAVARLSPAAAWADPAAMTQFLLDKPALNILFDGLFAIAPDGSALVRLDAGKPAQELPNVADRAYFQQAMQTDQMVLSDPLRGKVTQQGLVILAMPVIAPDGARLGVLAGVVRLRSSSLFSEGNVHSRSEGTINLVVDRRGAVLAHPDTTRLLTPAAEQAGIASVIQRWRDDGSPIDLDGRAALSEGHLVTIAGIPSSDWLHVRVTPEAVAMKPLQAANRAAWRAAGVAGALAALVAGCFSWLSVRPITRLRDRALGLAEGKDDADHSGQPWHHGRNELGDMGRAFEQLLVERRRQQSELTALFQQVESVLDHADVGIALTVHSRFARVSRRLCQTLRCERAELLGRATSMLHASEAAYQAFSDRARPAFMAHGAFECEVELIKLDGQAFWARMRGRAIAPGDLSAGTIWVVEDVTEVRTQRESLSYSASHDGLTGLLNRAAFEALLEAAVADAREHPFCALFIDLDRFKLVNDTGGHAAGDALLCGVAAALGHCLRRNDVVARLGGDEFAVLLPDCPGGKGKQIGEALRAAVEAYALDWQGKTHQVGASIGLTIGTGHHASAADVLRDADTQCYAAKREGRNRLAFMKEPVA